MANEFKKGLASPQQAGYRLSRLYWVLQFGGWGGLGIIALTFFALNEAGEGQNKGAWSLDAILPITLFCLLGLLITHAFRLIVTRQGWYRLPVWRLAIQVLMANLIMACVFIGLILAWGLATGGYTLVDGQDMINLAIYIVNTSFIFLIWSLIYFVQYAFRNYRLEEIERLRAQQARRESEINRLKSQMNPHFVFNALNSIRALIAENPERAQQSVTQLSHLLRGFLLSDRHKTVPLAEELRTLEDYLQLEKLRYEDRLQYRMTIAEDTLDWHVPTLTLQTLAENAIKHGISQSMEGGELLIETSLQTNGLHVCIANTGSLPSALDMAGREPGFGLANTQDRLDLLYGSRAEFKIYERTGGQVVAEIIIADKRPQAIIPRLTNL